ncbi:MAG: hypothetical protein R3F02_12105 [Thiolinea sp.]
MRFFLPVVWLSLVLVSLSGCNSQPDATDYFPLDKGLSWQYQVTNSAQQEQSIYRVTNLGTTEVAGETVTVRRANDGHDYYLERKPDGIYRYASRTLFETYPAVDEPPRMVLPLPYLKAAERTWASKTVSYVIRRIGPSTVTSVNNPIPGFVMNYRVAAEDETVEVPAGRFEHCLLVEGTAKLTMFTDPLTGYEDVPVTTREWYAPGVGLVKLERVEPLETRVYQGGSYLFELVGFD